MNTSRTTLVVAIALYYSAVASGFVATTTCTTTRRQQQHPLQAVVVVSPPGGVGEVTAVQAAQRGSDVRWFVISSGGDTDISLTRPTLETIQQAGGSVTLAGASVSSLLEDDAVATNAIASWWNDATDSMEALVSTVDGVTTAKKKRQDGEEDPEEQWKNAVKVATQKISQVGSPKRCIAVLSADEDVAETEDGAAEGGIGNLVGSLLGQSSNSPSIPTSLVAAMQQNSKSVLKLRHGALFGTPESSPDFSPLLGGPKREPELCEEYTMRTIRVDPTLSVAGKYSMMGATTRSSRHAMGEAAALLVLEQVLPTTTTSTAAPNACSDMCVSSQPGKDPVTLEEWQTEFARVQDVVQSGAAATLFSFTFASVPDTERLADWLTTKWAPAVLRTYDIAAIRIGARPVYANRSGKPGEVEITWQELIDFQTKTVGRMIIRVTDTGLTAIRGPGDAAQGFGTVSPKPLAGEEVLVRRLAEAAAQAMEKGLAVKVRFTKVAVMYTCCIRVLCCPFCVDNDHVSNPSILWFEYQPRAIQKTKPKPKPVKVTPPPPVAAAKPVASKESGPRTAGARRSVERKRRKSAPKDTPSS